MAEYQTLVDLAEAARRVNRAVRLTQVDDSTADKAARILAEAADLLESDLYEGPNCQVGLGGGEDIFATEFGDPNEFFPYSPVVGALNPISPPVEMRINDHNELTGRMVLAEQYNGPPWDLAHGGVIAQIFDEFLGCATVVGAGGGFTGRLTIRYHKPTPIKAEIEIAARVDEVRGRKILASGEMRHNGQITAEAEGLFISRDGILSE
jgi:acyl-coenzyme A thioesterase PaaI-like protein